jgi:hypothetical protein
MKQPDSLVRDDAELARLVTDYAYAIDERDWDTLDRVFTPDAYIDYRAMGGIDGPYPKIKAWLPEALKSFPAYMHFIGNLSFRVEGDAATGKVACFNPMVVPRPDQSGSDTMFLGLWYLDRYVRTRAGWRIAERVEKKAFEHGMPQWMKQALKLE